MYRMVLSLTEAQLAGRMNVYPLTGFLWLNNHHFFKITLL